MKNTTRTNFGAILLLFPVLGVSQAFAQEIPVAPAPAGAVAPGFLSLPQAAPAALTILPESYGVIAGPVQGAPTAQSSLTEGLVMQINQQLKNDHRLHLVDVELARTMNKQPRYIIRARILEVPHSTTGATGISQFAKRVGGLNLDEVKTSARVVLEVIDMESFEIVASAEGIGMAKETGVKLGDVNLGGSTIPSIPAVSGADPQGQSFSSLDSSGSSSGKRVFSFERFASSREGKALDQALKKAVTSLYTKLSK